MLELDFWAVKFLFFLRRDLNSHHWYTAAPIAEPYVQRPRPLDHIRSIYILTNVLSAKEAPCLIIHKRVSEGVLETLFNTWSNRKRLTLRPVRSCIRINVNIKYVSFMIFCFIHSAMQCMTIFTISITWK